MPRIDRLNRGALAALILLTAGTAEAQLTAEVGGWQVTLSGGAGGFLTMTSCDKSASPGITGGIACAVGPDGKNRSAVESGLMPGFIDVNVKTTASGWDVGGNIGAFSGLNSTGGGAKTGFGNTTMDMRKNYAFFGRKDLGTFKVGRDIALFGQDAIFNDMALVGAGSGAAFPVGFQTTFGRIGVGYIYADWVPQLAYTSPDLSGFQATAALIQSWTVFGTGGTLAGHDTPGVQARLTYDLGGSVPAHLWAGTWLQSVQSLGDGAIPTGKSLSTSAFEVGARVNPLPALSLVGYLYTGSGAGTTGVGFNAFAWDGTDLKGRDSLGYYAQATYKVGDLKIGGSYGSSQLDLAANETAGGSGDLVKSNSSIIGGLYYSLSPNLTLTAEWTGTTSKSHGGTSVSDNSLAAGAYIFF